jgi:hypothetical protein
MTEKLKQLKILGIMLAVFMAAYFIPFETLRFKSGVMEAFSLLQEYARLHVLLCLVRLYSCRALASCL